MYSLTLSNNNYSDVGEAPDVTDPLFLDKCYLDDGRFISGPGSGAEYCCPASPTTVPAASKSRNNSAGMTF